MTTLYEAAKAVVDSLPDGPVFADSVEADNLTVALSAQQATWRERRESALAIRPSARFPYRGNLLIGEIATNEYFGYSADGSVDYLEDKP